MEELFPMIREQIEKARKYLEKKVYEKEEERFEHAAYLEHRGFILNKLEESFELEQYGKMYMIVKEEGLAVAFDMNPQERAIEDSLKRLIGMIREKLLGFLRWLFGEVEVGKDYKDDYNLLEKVERVVRNMMDKVRSDKQLQINSLFIELEDARKESNESIDVLNARIVAASGRRAENLRKALSAAELESDAIEDAIGHLELMFGREEEEEEYSEYGEEEEEGSEFEPED